VLLIQKTMKKYLICYWAERNDEATDLETFVEADNITEALKKFKANNVFKSIDSVSLIVNPNYTPDFDYETRM
jgi:hypothetical protein